MHACRIMCINYEGTNQRITAVFLYSQNSLFHLGVFLESKFEEMTAVIKINKSHFHHSVLEITNLQRRSADSYAALSVDKVGFQTSSCKNKADFRKCIWHLHGRSIKMFNDNHCTLNNYRCFLLLSLNSWISHLYCSCSSSLFLFCFNCLQNTHHSSLRTRK